MPALRTIMNVALGYGARAEDRSGPRYRQPTATLAYGKHPLQELDVHCAEEAGQRPLLVFVHGGAWQYGDKTRRLKDHKIPFAQSQGWHFAALNFRMVPEVGVTEMARDVAAGVALLFAQAAQWGIDPRRIVLMGHSSGAHLAALVATDPALLGAHGLAASGLAGVIAIDGAAYDPALPSTTSRLLARRLIAPAFADVHAQAVSPVAHLQLAAAAPVPFLLLAAQQTRIVSQSQLLANALRAAGGAATLHAFAERGVRGHVRLSRQFGREGYPPTEIARSWLRELLG